MKFPSMSVTAPPPTCCCRMPAFESATGAGRRRRRSMYCLSVSLESPYLPITHPTAGDERCLLLYGGAREQSPRHCHQLSPAFHSSVAAADLTDDANWPHLPSSSSFAIKCFSGPLSSAAAAPCPVRNEWEEAQANKCPISLARTGCTPEHESDRPHRSTWV